ncbi:MAG TPA: hypothetical protein HPP77_01680 [Candidatus Hydrogenedentes bacterium]|nr:hypothetical protein [Candidatus Hydrogenedentota bacterium]
MTDNQQFRERLIEQNGIAPQRVFHEDRDTIERILKRDRARVRRMKWITIVVWVAVPLAAVGSASGILGPLSEGLGLSSILLFYLALFCTIAYAIRAGVARHREQQAHMIEIEARLAETQEAIKQIAEKLE